MSHLHVQTHREGEPLAVVLIYPDAWEAQLAAGADRALVSNHLVEAAFTLSDVAGAPLPRVLPGRAVYDQEQRPEGT